MIEPFHFAMGFLFSTSVFLIVLNLHSTVGYSLVIPIKVPYEQKLTKYYVHSATNLISDRLNGTKFCESILLPSDRTLRKSLEAIFFQSRTDSSDENDRLDSCCRSWHKCDAWKNLDLGRTNDFHIRHCECVHSFRTCLKSVNTPASTDLAFIHSINATKCYAVDHPIIKCSKFEAYSESGDQSLEFLNSIERETFYRRCKKYELDESKPKAIQLFDLPSENAHFVETKIEEMRNLVQQVQEVDAKQVETKDELASLIMRVIRIVMELGSTSIESYIETNNDGGNIQLAAVSSSLYILDGNRKKLEKLKSELTNEAFKKLLKIGCKNGKWVTEISSEQRSEPTAEHGCIHTAKITNYGNMKIDRNWMMNSNSGASVSAKPGCSHTIHIENSGNMHVHTQSLPEPSNINSYGTLRFRSK